MRGTKWLALAGALILLAALSAPAPSLPADAPAEVELDGRPLVALTFDDGPRSSTTGPLLEGLALREVPATFFLVGSRVAGNEELVRRMAQEGHQIGVHTFDHVELKGLTRREFDLQVGKTRAALAEEGDRSWSRMMSPSCTCSVTDATTRSMSESRQSSGSTDHSTRGLSAHWAAGRSKMP